MNKTSRVILLIVIFLALLGVIYAGYYYSPLNKKLHVNNVNSTYIPKVQLVQTPGKELPPGITVNMIQEKNPEIIQNYSATNEKGDTQSTIQYVTKIRGLDNMNAYLKYLGTHGWPVYQPSAKMTSQTSFNLISYKGNSTMNVSMETDRVTGRNIVDISLVTKNSAQ